MSEQVKVSESIRLGTLLAFSGGFLDAYTFMTRDGTFANAETGNIVRVGIYAALGEYGKSLYYMIPVIAFAIGIFVAVWFREKMNAMEKVHWKEAILLVEILVLFMAGFMPQSMNPVVTSSIAFVCALQAQTFRRVHGLPFASTMCTGNLRSGTEAFFHFWLARDSRELRKSLHYYGVIICFVAGALFGTLLLRDFGLSLFFLAPAGLFAAFLLITPKRRLALWRRTVKRLYRRSKREQPDAPSR